MDNVLIYGNEIYFWIYGLNELLFILDLLDMIEILGKMMYIRKKDLIIVIVDLEEKIDYSVFDRCMLFDIVI